VCKSFFGVLVFYLSRDFWSLPLSVMFRGKKRKASGEKKGAGIFFINTKQK
jgi:hypothetical protein